MTMTHTLRIIVLALLVLVIAGASLHALTSVQQDIGRHLVLGERIVSTWHVPTTNLFSYTNTDFPFINHHWLGEVFIFLAARVFDLTGLIVLKAVLIAGAFFLTLRAGYRKGRTLTAVLVGILSFCVLIERTDVRPEILSFLFFGIFLFVLMRRASTKLLWILPVVQLLWVNAHIYFFMGPLLVGAFMVGEAVKKNFQTRRMILLGSSMVLATLINPWFVRGALYPLRILNGYGYSIVENQNPFFLHEFGYPWFTTWALFAALAVGALSFILNHRRIRENIFGLILFVVTGAFSLIMVRNYPLFALTFLAVTLKNLSEIEWHIRDTVPRLFATALLLIALLYGVADNQFYKLAGLHRTFGLAVPTGAQGATDFVRERGLSGPIFNNFDIGSFLIWKLPEIPVFIDGRPEAYPKEFIQGIYIPMQENPEVWDEKVEEYGIKLIFWNTKDITPWSRAFVTRIENDPEWSIVYRDSETFVAIPREGQ